MNGVAAAPTVSFDHLLRLSDDIGLFEHAELTVPRRAHGYCVDDVARGLLVVVREPDAAPELDRLARIYLRFLLDAQAGDGRFRNRLGADGRWTDQPSLEDCWGRALWGLGACAARSVELGKEAMRHFDVAATRRSPHLRAMAFAGLGAAEVVAVYPDHRAARALLYAAAELIASRPRQPSWLWPEPRLRYANAALPETLLAAGSLLGDAWLLDDGLAMLDWLLNIESAGEHLSVTGVGGWTRGEPKPAFDQQPIEVAALADACARAFDITGDERWRREVVRAADWFLGKNDAHVSLLDEVSGGGCDGLELRGRNENQGAESTLALISTFQQSRRLLSLQT